MNSRRLETVMIFALLCVPVILSPVTKASAQIPLTDSWTGEWRVTMWNSAGDSSWEFIVDLEQSGSGVMTKSSTITKQPPNPGPPPGPQVTVRGTGGGGGPLSTTVSTLTGKLTVSHPRGGSVDADITWVMSSDGLTFTGDWVDPLENFATGKMTGERLSGPPSDMLLVEVQVDFIGDQGAELVIRVLEPATPQDRPVANALVRISVLEEGTGQTPWGITGATSWTDENGYYRLQWDWTDPRAELDRGKTWIVTVEASRPSSIGGWTGTMGWAQTSISVPLGSDRLRVDINDENSADECILTVRVWEVGSEEPIGSAILWVRVFKTHEGSTNTAIDGLFWDYGPFATNEWTGEKLLTMSWEPGDLGDIYRIDVYAEKEGYGEDSTSTHVVGGAILAMGESTAQTTIQYFTSTQDTSPYVLARSESKGNDMNELPFVTAGIVALVAIGSFFAGRRYPARANKNEAASKDSPPAAVA